MKKITSGIMLLFVALSTLSLWGAAPSGYYDSAQGKNKAALLSALESIVGNHTVVSYNGLWTLYKTSDVTSDGYIWDMYATTKFKLGTNQCGTYSNIGSCYNREHSFPKSWFNDASPMVSDAYHIYPTDGYVNNQRSNYPFGECANGTRLPANGTNKSLGKLGTSTFSGYTGTVFEPDDIYKGDFARSYFYMAAAYNSKISSWSSPQLSGNSYPAFSTWSVNLLLKWNREDPVSQKELDRNEVVYGAQHNRNPFIDHPELAEYIWGNKQAENWVPGGTVDPVLAEPTSGSTEDFGYCAVNRTITKQLTVKAAGLTEDLSVVKTGDAAFSVTPTTITKDNANAGTTITITYTPTAAGTSTATLQIGSGEVSATVTLTGQATDGIPALPATNITANSFNANWTDVDGSGNYDLTLFESDGTTSVMGYPVSVSAAAGTYAISGLNGTSDYYYQLSRDSRVSNKVKVTTLEPEKILTFSNLSGSGLKFTALPNKPSDAKELTVYTENLTENVSAVATGNFEVSLDKANWSSTIENMSPQGESMYIRLKSTSAEGEYTGNLSLSSGTFDGDIVDLTGTVAAARTFFEDFESISLSSYDGGTNVQGTACKWNLVDVGAYGRVGQDKFHGTQAICFGKTSTSSATMAEDKMNGLGTLSFWAAPYGTDGDAIVAVSYSTDGGSTWKVIATPTITGALTQYSYSVNVEGPVRVRLVQTSGKRVNLDDISMSDFSTVTGVTGVNARPWDAWSVSGGVMLESSKVVKVEIYGADAVLKYSAKQSVGKTFIGLEKGVYVVVSGNDAKKVIIK